MSTYAWIITDETLGFTDEVGTVGPRETAAGVDAVLRDLEAEFFQRSRQAGRFARFTTSVEDGTAAGYESERYAYTLAACAVSRYRRALAEGRDVECYWCQSTAHSSARCELAASREEGA